MDLRRKVFLNEEGDVRSLVGGTVALAARFNQAGERCQGKSVSPLALHAVNHHSPPTTSQSVFPDVDQRFVVTGV